MTSTRTRASLALAMALLLAGCASSPPSRFFTLAAPVAAEGAPMTLGLAVTVGPVAIPAVVDRPEIVVTVGPNEVWLDEYNRWAAPLADGIGLALVGHLGALLPSPQVTLLAQSPGGPGEIAVAVEVQRFDSVPGAYALVDAAFVVRHTATGRSEKGRTTVREPAADKSYDALAAAHSRAVARLARDIAGAVAIVASAGASPAASSGSTSPRR